MIGVAGLATRGDVGAGFVVLLLAIPVLWSVLSHLGLLNFFENRTIDWRFQRRGEIPAPVKIVYVDVDSRSIGDIGRHADGGAARFDRIIGGHAGQFRIMVEIGDRSACFSEPVGNGAADAAARSCHKGHTPCMRAHLRTSSMILPR